MSFVCDAPEQPWDYARWETLKNRLFDELARGYTMLRVAIETKPPEKNIWMQKRDADSWKTSIEQWAQDGSKFRSSPRNFGEVCLAEMVETALESWFSELDRERAENPKEIDVPFVLTSVSRKIIEGFQDARDMKKPVEIETPPGSGKTFTTAHYLAGCRKAEGFKCSVWSIALRGTNCTLKIILYEIALAMYGGDSYTNGHPPKLTWGENGLSNYIYDRAATHKGGLLIIDEAQNMFESNSAVTNGHGIAVINELRRFTDAKLFGIALLSNGEILRQAKAQKSDQVTRRMEAWRIRAGKPTAEDVDLFMAAWNVSGKEERAWCVRIGTAAGGLGALIEAFIKSLRRFNKISFATLQMIEKA